MADPMEQLIADALTARGLQFVRGDDGPARLDFHLPALDVHIEVKRFHSPRIGEQMQRAENVIAAQGERAVRLLASLLAAPRAEGGAGEPACRCGRAYSLGPDLVIPDHAWARIAPRPDGGGVLCPNCIHDALVAAGFAAGTVSAAFKSGPMADDVGASGDLRNRLRLPVALAIKRADNEHIEDGYADKWPDPARDHDELSDWSAYIADRVLNVVIAALQRAEAGA